MMDKNTKFYCNEVLMGANGFFDLSRFDSLVKVNFQNVNCDVLLPRKLDELDISQITKQMYKILNNTIEVNSANIINFDLLNVIITKSYNFQGCNISKIMFDKMYCQAQQTDTIVKSIRFMNLGGLDFIVSCKLYEHISNRIIFYNTKTQELQTFINGVETKKVVKSNKHILLYYQLLFIIQQTYNVFYQ